MINLTVNIPVANAISSLRRWQVTSVEDDVEALRLVVRVQVLGPGAVPYGSFVLYAYDAQPSHCLAVNPAPQSTQDQLRVVDRVLAGTPYTTLAAAYHGSGNTRAARLRNVENALVGSGLMDTAFSGA